MKESIQIIKSEIKRIRAKVDPTADDLRQLSGLEKMLTEFQDEAEREWNRREARRKPGGILNELFGNRV